jgi:hypothetical protein
MKKRPHELGKIFAIHIADKEHTKKFTCQEED